MSELQQGGEERRNFDAARVDTAAIRLVASAVACVVGKEQRT